MVPVHGLLAKYPEVPYLSWGKDPGSASANVTSILSSAGQTASLEQNKVYKYQLLHLLPLPL